MKLEIKEAAYYCEPEKFIINDIEADSSDFGEKKDMRPDLRPPYGCGDMQFIPYEQPTKDVLERYHINEDEYHEICDKLVDIISIGRCCLCE